MECSNKQTPYQVAFTIAFIKVCNISVNIPIENSFQRIIAKSLCFKVAQNYSYVVSTKPKWIMQLLASC